MQRAPFLALALAFVAAHTARAQAADPPARVGRVSALSGNVSLYPVGDSDWTTAAINYPLTTDDAIWADSGARAEVELGASAVRIAAQTSVVLGEISDTVTQMRIDQGSIDVHVRYLSDDEIYEIDTPAGVVSLLGEGHYRIDVTPDGKRATITVRDGGGQITIGDRTFQIAANSSAVLTDASRPPIITAAIPEDSWEQWADARAQREDAVQSTDYVSRDMVGYEDLDNNGTWQTDATYGSLWIPRNVPAGWAPYRFGHWGWVAPWGWTWIDDASWGFAPFHYGRWAYVSGRWGWTPGTVRLRPVYAPALVAFVGGPGFGASLTAGGPPVGWVALAPGEPFIPGYRATPEYIRQVNTSNVDVARFDFNRVDPAQVRYVNRSAPNGVTVVPRDVFARARPVSRAIIAVRPADLTAARPTPVPFAGTERISALPREMPTNRAGAPHPPSVPDARTAPPRPASWRTRPGAPAAGSANPQTARPVTPTTAQPPAPTPLIRNPQPTTPPATTSQPPAPSTPPSATATVRNPQVTPAVRPAPVDNTKEWQDRRAQLIAHQQQEAVDLDKRHQQQRATVPATAAPQVQKQQQQEKQQLNQKQQHERDQLDKQYRKPGGH